MIGKVQTVLAAMSLLAVALGTSSLAGAQEQSAPANQDLKIWFAQPAGQWEEALPIGNGRMGAMVFGGSRDADANTVNTAVDRIQFNEDTLWTGKPHDYVRKGAIDALPEIRKLIFEGKAEEAAPVVRSRFLSDPVRQKMYQPFGNLRFTFPGHEKVTQYRRELNLDNAIATVSYAVNGVTHTRETFASHPAGAVISHIAASQPGQVNFTLRIDTPHEKHGNRKVDDHTLAVFGQVKDPKNNNELGMSFEGQVRVLNQGGTLKVTDDAIEVSGADSATIELVANTDFVSFQDISGDPKARCVADLKKLDGKAYDALKSEHIADYQSLFHRVTVDFGRSEQAKLPTNERLDKIREALSNYEKAVREKSAAVPDAHAGLVADPSFLSLYFQWGRYMLIASSRPGDQPANLQGVWNELMDPPWESKFTTNINFEMNYWPAEVTNLTECHEPLFSLVHDLTISGHRTAKEQYGCDGWVLHHNTDQWRGTAPINNIDGMWPTGGAWVSYHLWEHYLFTGDQNFLATRAYPAMKGASQFFVDFLIPDPKTGYLVTNPSHSPEQGPLNAGPAMDMQLIRAIFDATCEASEILGIDADFAQKLRETRSRLVPDQVGKFGQLQEWKEDLDVPGNNHRHMSPLWGLYPGAEFTPENPKIYDAAKVLLKWRGDGSTGWSYAWRIPLWARVYDGNFALRQLEMQISKRTFPNLFDKCGPFQVDGNFGATGGLVELMLQSHRRVPESRTPIVHLLPALPTSWTHGTIAGLRARGGFTVDLAWDNSKLKQATLTSSLGGPVRLQLGDKTVDLKTEAGKQYQIGSDLSVNPQ